MSKVCDICKKGSKKGNLVPRGIGRRVTSRTIRRQMPNLRNRKIKLDGRSIKATICTSCLKKFKKDPEYAKNLQK